MWTASTQPSGVVLMEMASSKSLALAGSMVMTVRSVQSSRLASSLAEGSAGSASAS